MIEQQGLQEQRYGNCQARAPTEEDADQANRELMERLNRTGKAYLARTVFARVHIVRGVSTLQ